MTKEKLAGSTALAGVPAPSAGREEVLSGSPGGKPPEKKDPLERIKAMGGVQPLSLSIPELVALSGIGRTAIYSAISAGRLRIRKVGRRSVVPIGEARRFIAGESAAGQVDHERSMAL